MSATSISSVTAPNCSARKNLLGRVAELVLRSPEPELQDILGVTATEVRSFLKIDRVKIYQFHADGSGWVIAESVDEDRLPSLLGLNFPADDIPESARELFVKARMRSIVDVKKQQIGQSLHDESGSIQEEFEEMSYRPIDPCHAEYLTAMGVQCSLVVPILQAESLWGLLVAHHREPHAIANDRLQDLQILIDHLEVAISQANLLTEARERGQREAIVNQIGSFFQIFDEIDLQAALEETVKALQGSGGRLYFRTDVIDERNGIEAGTLSTHQTQTESVRLLTCGSGPVMPERAMYPMMEQYSVWGRYFAREEHRVWAIADLYGTPELRNLQAAFQPTQIQGILTVPLRYGDRLLGYLSVFRDEIETEKLWAGEFDPDRRQEYPRISFEIWRQSLGKQAFPWTDGDLELGQTLAKHFATAIVQDAMQQRVKTLNTSLERQVEERTSKLQQATDQQQALFEVVAKMRQSLDLETIFNTMAREVRRVLKTDRVGIYRFDPNSEFNEGEFVAEDVNPEFSPALGAKIRDRCFGDTYATKYARGRVNALTDIHNAGLEPCYVEILARFEIQANMTAPVLKGDRLWGLLCIHQCSQPRVWEESEIQFATQIAAQVSVALEQASLLDRTRQQSTRLQQATEQQRVLYEVVAKIRESLDLEQIFTTTVKEVRQTLKTDRVGVFRFYPESNFNDGEFVSEDVLPEFSSAIATPVRDRCFGEQYAVDYAKGRIQAVADIQNAGLQECHIAVLDRFQIKANLAVPLRIGGELWGLLCVHQCARTRQWEDSEIQFAKQIADQLGVALGQAKLLDRTRQQTVQLSQMLRELRETQTQLIQSEKMSSLGQLVAGVAHEINNPVNFIYGNLVHTREYTRDLLGLVELYQQQCTENHPEIAERIEEVEPEYLAQDLPKMLASMKVGVDRIRQIVLSLLSFSRLDQADLKAVDLHEGLDSTLLILQHRLKAKSDRPEIEVVKEYGDLPLVECYAGQLNQVFMNLLSNAIDAIEQCGKLASEPYQGRIHLRTWMETQPDSKTPAIVIELSDNGMGIPESVRPKIFDPFFTTKPVGKGTGLGLSISYQIVVDKHGGDFSYTSQPQKGTTFRMEIPSCQMN